MKKYCAVLAAALIVALMSATTVYAAPVGYDEDLYAVALLENGREVILAQIPDADIMENVDEYEIIADDEPILSVEHITNDAAVAQIPSSYYSVDFTFADTHTEVFLTGLRAEYVEEIQAKIISNYVEGENFEMEDLGFIDTEKTREEDGDDNLCWAATTANMLYYSGWAAKAGFTDEDEDDIFELFINEFSNQGSNPKEGLGWFFNGLNYYGQHYPSTYAVAANYPNSGRYLNRYAYDDLYRWDNVMNISDANDMMAKIREGYAVGLSLNLYYYDDVYNGGYGGSHSVTLWGYAVDDSLAENDPERLLHIFVTDSDSHELRGTDRRNARDVMLMAAVTPTEKPFPFTLWLNSYTLAEIREYDYLLPYSDDVPYETSNDASLDSIRDADINVNNVYISDTDEAQELVTTFETGTDIYLGCTAINNGEAAYSGRLTQEYTVKDADNKVVFKKSYSYPNVSLDTRYYYVLSCPQAVSGLAAGDYTVTFAMNNAHDVAEAYYYNNTRTVELHIRDAYLLGDVNNDGEVNIMDATQLQRILARYSVSLDENYEQRADINGGGLNITNATIIQRYVARYTLPYDVGGRYLYE